MSADDPKRQQRIARRKERVQRLIAEQETRLAAVGLVIYARRKDCIRNLSWTLDKLHRLRQELSALKAARCPDLGR